jgi:DNA-binding CsgD family transcriptional regulator
MMIVGRESERQMIDARLTQACRGIGGALFVHGEPGIGKTALLAYADERAAGMRVLRARGVEAEAELAFAGMLELLRPLLPLLALIPEGQAGALRGALGLGPPVEARLLVSAGVLSLVAAAAEERPVLLLVDDAQWLDRESADAFVFVARRLEADPALFLFAARDGDPRSFEPAGVEELVLGGLEPAEASLLLRGRALPERVVEDLIRSVAGNPLALLELPDALSERQRTGEEPLTDPLPVTRAVQGAFARRIADLPAETRLALVVAAAEPSFELRIVARACGRLGVDAAALERAEDAGLVTLAVGQVSFRHPLVCAAAYHSASSAERRAVHRGLAEAFEADGDADRRAWHLAAAALGPDEEVATALEGIGGEAVRRSGYSMAVAAFKRAAELTPDGGPRARRLYRAVDATFAVGALTPGTMPLLERAAAAVTDDDELHYQIHALRTAIASMADPNNGRKLMLEEAERIAERNPREAALLLTHAARFAISIDDAPSAVEEALKARALLGSADPGPFLTTVHGAALYASGNVVEAKPLLEQAIELGRDVEHGWGTALAGLRLNDLAFQTPLAFQTLLAIGRDEAASACVSAGIEWARPRGAQSGWLLTFRGRIELEEGRWTSAWSNLIEGSRLCAEVRYYHPWWCGCVAAAELAAARGAAEQVDRYVAEAAQAEAAYPSMASNAWLDGGAPGLLALGLGRYDDAADAYERLLLPRVQALKLFPELADAIEALARAGRAAPAETLLEEFAAQAQTCGWAWALARTAHLRAILNPTETLFEEALRLYEQAERPFPRARAELAYGEWLRRSGRRVDARVVLHAALRTFEQLGAAPWEDRAGAELRATGERVRRRSDPDTSQLTTQELQVALVVARGATNKEAAAQLYLSPKTIEKHLGSAYSKLGLRSRTELAGVLLLTSAPLVHDPATM